MKGLFPQRLPAVEHDPAPALPQDKFPAVRHNHGVAPSHNHSVVLHKIMVILYKQRADLLHKETALLYKTAPLYKKAVGPHKASALLLQCSALPAPPILHIQILHTPALHGEFQNLLPVMAQVHPHPLPHSHEVSASYLRGIRCVSFSEFPYWPPLYL